MAILLSPDQFGVVYMVTAFTNFAFVFSDFGLSTVTLQKADLSHRESSNLFWLNTLSGLILFLLGVALANPIGMLYGDERIPSIVICSSLIFLINGVYIQHSALIRRDMRFKQFVVVEITALFVSTMLGIMVAFLTGSYWSIVIAMLARSVTQATGFISLSKFRPTAYSSTVRVREMLTLGADVALFDMINYWSRNIDNVVVGKFLGPDSLGLYKKAYDLLLLPVTQVRAPLASVALPHMSKMQQDPQNVSLVYSRLISSLSLVTTTIVVLAVVACEYLVPLVLGEEWVEVSTLFKYLAPAAMVQGPIGTLGLLLLSLNQSRKYLKWGAAHAAVMIVAIISGSLMGMMELAMIYSAANILVSVPSIFYCTRGTFVNPVALTKKIYEPITVGAGVMFVSFFIDTGSLFIDTLIGLVLSGLVMICYFILNKEKFSLIGDVSKKLLAKVR